MIFRFREIIESLPSTENKYLAFVDCETTNKYDPLGSDMIAQSTIITDYSLDIKDKKTFYARPESKKYWNEESAEIHGYSFTEAMQFPDPRTTAIEMLHFFKPFKHEGNHPIIFISHDLNWFDYKFNYHFFQRRELERSFEKIFNNDHRISTIKMGRMYGYKQNKLDICAERIGFPLNHHNAESDVMACYLYFKFLMEDKSCLLM